MKDQNGILILLFVACFFPAVFLFADNNTDPEDKSDSPFNNARFFHRNDRGNNLTLIFFQQEDGRWMLNVEPGCIIAEVEHREIREDTFRFTFSGQGMVGFAKAALKIKTDTFDVLYEAQKPPTMNRILKISEVSAPNHPEHDDNGQSPARSEPK